MSQSVTLVKTTAIFGGLPAGHRYTVRLEDGDDPRLAFLMLKRDFSNENPMEWSREQKSAPR